MRERESWREKKGMEGEREGGSESERERGRDRATERGEREVRESKRQKEGAREG